MSNPKRQQAGLVLWIRSLLFWCVFLVSVVLLAIPVMLFALVAEPVAQWLVSFWVNLNLGALKVLCGLDHRVIGEENIPDEPVIIFAKHQSTWETLYLQQQFPGVVFVAKRELSWIPFFGWALACRGYILINRSAGRKAIRQMVEQYEVRKSQGRSLVIFPEGTRMPVGAKPNYKLGGAIVAVETDTPLLPVALNTGVFWPRHSFIKYPGTITIEFGPLERPDGRAPEQLRDEAQAWIEGRMADLV